MLTKATTPSLTDKLGGMEGSSGSAAGALLRRQLKQMQSGKDIPGISCGLVKDENIFEWEVMLMINDDCKYYGGKFDLLVPHHGVNPAISPASPQPTDAPSP